MGHRQARRTGKESPVAVRGLLTRYKRQLDRQQARITTLENRIKTQELLITLIRGIRRASSATLELDSLFPVFLEMILKAVDADYGVLLQIDPDQKKVLFGVQKTKDGSAVSLGDVSLARGYRRQALKGDHTTLLRTIKRPPSGWVIPRFRGNHSSLLVVPLQVSGRVVGLLELLR